MESPGCHVSLDSQVAHPLIAQFFSQNWMAKSVVLSDSEAQETHKAGWKLPGPFRPRCLAWRIRRVELVELAVFGPLVLFFSARSLSGPAPVGNTAPADSRLDSKSFRSVYLWSFCCVPQAATVASSGSCYSADKAIKPCKLGRGEPGTSQSKKSAVWNWGNLGHTPENDWRWQALIVDKDHSIGIGGIPFSDKSWCGQENARTRTNDLSATQTTDLDLIIDVYCRYKMQCSDIIYILHVWIYIYIYIIYIIYVYI